MVAYYVRCAKTNNHTVREAACSCLGELFVKIDRAAVEPHLPKIQRTLLRGLKDDSWTVGPTCAPNVPLTERHLESNATIIGSHTLSGRSSGLYAFRMHWLTALPLVIPHLLVNSRH